MAIDFPNSPTNGQTFSGPNGVIWQWDGVKWIAIPGTNPSVGAGNVGRNLLHNPLFNVAQRGVGPFIAGGYTIDRWLLAVAADVVSIRQWAATDADRTGIGDEAAIYYLSNNFTGSAAAGAYNEITHRIEFARRLAGKTVTLSFWANASASLKLGINILQHMGSGGSPSADVSALATGNAVTLGTAWARYSTTIAIPSLSGKTLGTNNDDWTGLRIAFSSGASANAYFGNIGVQSGSINIWGIQLEVGSVATPLEKPDPRYDLANCQRFFVSGLRCMMCAVGAAGQQLQQTMALPVTMRGAITFAVAAAPPPAYSNCSGAALQYIGLSSVAVNAVVTTSALAAFDISFTASADL